MLINHNLPIKNTKESQDNWEIVQIRKDTLLNKYEIA